MKRSIVTLCCILSAVLILAGAVFFLMGDTKETATETTMQKERELIRLLDESQIAGIETIEVSGSQGSYQLSLNRGNVEVPGIESLYADAALAKRIFNTIVNVEGYEISGTDQGFEQYGLDDPDTVIQVKVTDGEYRIYVGTQAPGSYGRYVSVENQNRVYLAYGISDARKDLLDFVDKTVVDISVSGDFVPSSIVLGGRVRQENIVLGIPETAEKEASIRDLKVLSKNNYDANYENISDGMADLMQLDADVVVCYEPSEADLAEFGLLDPYSTVTYCWKETDGALQECMLSASEPADGYVYLYNKEKPVVYKAAADAVSWLKWQYADVITRFLLLPNIYTVAAVEVSYADQCHTYTLESSERTIEKVLLDETQELDVEQFKAFYQCLIGIPAEEYTELVPEDAAPKLIIRFIYKDRQDTDTVELLEGPPLQVYLRINGASHFLTKSKHVQTILDNIGRLHAGQQPGPLY